MFDLISIGDCVIDTFVPLQDAEVEISHHKKKLVLRWGDKIPIGPSVTSLGGNAANNVIGASRLGLKSAVYTNIGNDQDAKQTLEKLKSEKVNTRYVVFNKDLPSNHHIVLDYKGERTILDYHQPWKYNLPNLDLTKWVYYTSLSPSFRDSNITDQVINFLERTSPHLVFNPGTYQIKAGLKKNAKLISLSDLFIVNVEEAKLILGFSEKEEIPVKKLLKIIIDLGAKNVVITDGSNGSYGADGQKYFKLGLFPAKVKEVTGAGDAYSTACMVGLFYGYTLSEAMRWGGANSASVVEYIGPQNGLLNHSQILEKLKQNSKIKTRELR